MSALNINIDRLNNKEVAKIGELFCSAHACPRKLRKKAG